MIKSPETNNARDMSPKKTVQTFVVTEDYVRLATPRNTIVLGSRGSGKTQLLRMLSYDLMCQLDRAHFINLPDKNSLIGIYVAFSSFWAKDIKSKSWDSEEDYLYSFKWRVNLATCDSFLKCLKSILAENVEDEFDQVLKASDIAEKLYEAWFFSQDPRIDSLDKLRNKIARYDDERQAREQELLAQGKRSGEHAMAPTAFDTPLFSPVKTARDIVEQELPELDQPNWLICLDEADFLDIPYLRAINTCMRSRSERLFIKMSTLPFSHRTQETETPVNIDSGHDFEYLYIDHETTRPDSSLNRQKFAFDLIKKHFDDKSELLSKYDSLKALLGESTILNPESISLNDEEFDRALNEFATEKTCERARTLKAAGKNRQYSESIVRKMRGALWLKKKRGERKGNRKPEVYFGTEVFLRCTDGNPRRMLELSRRLLENKKNDGQQISNRIQSNTIFDYSQIVLERCRTEEGIGYDLYFFMKKLLEALDSRFENKISSDTFYSFEVKEECDDETKRLIKKAVDLGLIYPNKHEAIAENFICEGKFHPAYILAPAYYLLPRKGSSTSLSSLMREAKTETEDQSKQKNQPSLFGV